MSSKKCICGQPVAYTNSSKCKPCRMSYQREYRAKKARAKISVSEHNYGIGDLPPGFNLKGVSQYVGADGKVKAQWVKSVADKDKGTEILMSAMSDMLEGYTGLVKPVKLAKGDRSDNLLTVIPLGDPHVGLHCWGEETGSDFDLKIAAENMHTATANLIASGPKTERCLIINLGDYFHADSSANTTTKGTPVDVDGRRIKVVRTGLEIFVGMINTALKKYPYVDVVCATGNHDGDSSKMLALMLDVMFKNEPRVNIDTRPLKFHSYRFGKCLLGITHGDTGKDAELPMIMANDFKNDWSECEYYRWYKGHVHHDSLKEYTGGVIVETFRTLAPSDSWHKGQGYRSGQDLKLDVYDKDFGFVQRNTIGIRKIEAIKNEIKRSKKGTR